METKHASIELSYRCQDKLEQNFDQVMKLNKLSADSKEETEAKFAALRHKVVTWMPNFSKYASEELYAKNLRFVLPNAGLLEDEDKHLWDDMEQRIKYDTNAEMWGFEDGETPVTVRYKG